MVVPFHHSEADEAESPSGELRHADLALVSAVCLNPPYRGRPPSCGRAQPHRPDAGMEAVDRLLAFGLLRAARGVARRGSRSTRRSPRPLPGSRPCCTRCKHAAGDAGFDPGRVGWRWARCTGRWWHPGRPRVRLGGAADRSQRRAGLLSPNSPRPAVREIRTSQPGGARKDEILTESMDRTDRRCGRGVRMRTLYQPRPSSLGHCPLGRAGQRELGAEIRTVGRRLHADAGLRRRGRRCCRCRATRTRPWCVPRAEPDRVRGGRLRACLDVGQAVPARLPADQVVAISDEMKLDIVRMLVEGMEDRAIAVRMGISLRTCQRHVSEVMDRLGARVVGCQAGYLIRERQVPEQT